MRPQELFTYFADIEGLPGIGKRTRDLFERLAGPRYRDILFHQPIGLIDRRYRPQIADAVPGSIVTLEVSVVAHQIPHSKRMPYKVVVQDDSSLLTLVFFHARSDYLQKQLPEGEVRIISGKLERFQDQPQITHPDYIVKPDALDELPLLEPIYPMTTGLSPKALRKAVAAAIKAVPELPNWHDESLIEKHQWPSFKVALIASHNPEQAEALEASDPARTRLAYDEIMANQLALALVRDRARRKQGRETVGDGRHITAIRDALPYSLTGDQENTITEILSDMANPAAMLRLVQGDVGSGKTIVALIAMLTAVESGAQAAILAPTEILARQHLASIKPLCDAIGVRVEILTGRNKGKARDAILADLKAGEIDMLVGTHAVIQPDVDFKDLGLAVIDEQHRFGVQQRLALTKKAGHSVDLLAMTATPIPRTLTLTAYGDMDVSRIQEKPPGRQPIDTAVISLDRMAQVVERIGGKLAEGARVYWVCPLVEESEQSDLAAAEDRFAHLKQKFGPQVGLVHGRMKALEKDAVMAQFKAGEISLLVATTVIEVGVDVPEATIMVIEHAERFGLAQLHQLRGRVGRGTARSNCLLLRSETIGQVASDRLRIMRESDDGFLIAEEDLRLRGAGEVLGTRQSGLPDLKLANLYDHAELFATARDDARLVIARDPQLSSERGKALRILLYLFERDEGVRLLQSG